MPGRKVPQGILLLFAELFPLFPASGVFTASAQSAQADFVSPAPDFNPGNLTYRSVVFQSGNNKAKSISACAKAHHLLLPILTPTP
jgi:hypothetical protein